MPLMGFRTNPTQSATAHPHLYGNGGVVSCPQEFADRLSLNAVEFLLVVMLSLLLPLPGTDIVESHGDGDAQRLTGML